MDYKYHNRGTTSSLCLRVSPLFKDSGGSTRVKRETGTLKIPDPEKTLRPGVRPHPEGSEPFVNGSVEKVGARVREGPRGGGGGVRLGVLHPPCRVRSLSSKVHRGFVPHSQGRRVRVVGLGGRKTPSALHLSDPRAREPESSACPSDSPRNGSLHTRGGRVAGPHA